MNDEFIRLEGPNKTTQNLSQDSRCLGQDSNPAPSTYESNRNVFKEYLLSKPWYAAIQINGQAFQLSLVP
jgi:hypothetical protein